MSPKTGESARLRSATHHKKKNAPTGASLISVSGTGIALPLSGVRKQLFPTLRYMRVARD